jgi:glycine cleavage system H protein
MGASMRQVTGTFSTKCRTLFAQAPTAGRKLRAGEAVKTAGDIGTPHGGEVVEVNAAVAANPALVNGDPFGAGWFFKLKPANPAELDARLTPAAYRAQIGG